MLVPKLRKVLVLCFGNLLYLVSLLIPKSNSIWVFGSWGGNIYADNPKYLYEYVSSYHPEIKAIWLSHNENIVAILKESGKISFKTNSILGFWYSCRARIGIISHGMVDINRFACAKMKIVQTWHGVPIKPILLSDPKLNAIYRRKKLLKLSLLFPYLKKELRFDHNFLICSSSEFVKIILKKAFGNNAPIENLGYPRLDPLFFYSHNQYARQIQKIKDEGKKVGIYMPTYRREGEYDILKDFTQNIALIDNGLKINGQILYIKIHPFDYHRISDVSKAECVRLYKNDDINSDIYNVLGVFDFMITDYSSVLFDYLILARPIYLMIPDRDWYSKSNGEFVYDYENLGLPTKDNWKDLLLILSQNNSDSDNNRKLETLSKMIHDNRDSKNCERVFNFIIDKI